MPRRDDLETILIIGSGPIVIGQACEFDYSGTQACRVLRDEGYRVVLVNSNPATIMTDPEFADATYVEPLDVQSLTRIIERERPDALLPTLGGQTALNLAIELHEAGVLDEYGVELIGASVDAIHTAENRHEFKAAMQEIGLTVAASGFAYTLDEAMEVAEQVGYPLIVRPSFILGGGGTGFAVDAEEMRRGRRARPRHQPGVGDPHRAVDRRVEGVRARGDARPRRQRGRHLLDRELRRHGRAHRRLDHGGARADPHRRRVPAHARRRVRVHPPHRRRHRRLEHPVRGEPRERRHRRHRDEPARVAQQRAREQGDRVPDREDRGAPRGRLPPRRDHQRHHRRDAGVVRADHRLRRHQGAALGVREAARRVAGARHDDAVGRRGDGDRAHVPRVAAEGAAFARDRAVGAQLRPHRARVRRALRRRARAHGRAAPRPSGRSCSMPRCAAGCRSSASTRPPASTPGSSSTWPRSSSCERGCAESRRRRPDAARVEAREARWASPTRSSRTCGAIAEQEVLAARERRRCRGHVQDRRHVRGGVRGAHAVPLRDLRGRGRGRAAHPARRRHPRAVARTASARASSSTTAACTPRSRSPTPASRRSCSTATPRPSPPTTTPATASSSSRSFPEDVLAVCRRLQERATDGRREPGRCRGGARWPDAAEAGPQRWSAPASPCSARAPTRSTSPRTASASTSSARRLGIAQPPGGTATTTGAGAGHRRRPRLPGARPPVVRARRPGHADRLRRRRASTRRWTSSPPRAASGARVGSRRNARCWSTVSSRTRSRSTSTPSATPPATSSSVASWSTSRRPGCTPATPRARSRRRP